MEGKKRSGFVEWVVYGLAVVSLATLIYLFTTRNNTTILLEDSSTQSVPGVVIAKSFSKEPKDSSTLNVQASIAKEDSKTPQELYAGSVPIKEIPKTSKNSRVVPKQQGGNHKKVSRTHKKSQQQVRIHKRRNKKRNLSKQEDPNYVCVPLKVYQKLTNTRGLNKYKKPVRVAYKNYNWTVLNRFPEKPRKILYKIGTYKVRSGDNVYTIAKKFNVKPINIMAINKKMRNPDVLFVGRVLFIPNH